MRDERGRFTSGCRGASHPRWKPGPKPNSERKRAQRLYPPRPCESCGAEYERRKTHRHHVDGDPGNNDAQNVVMLCWACHAAAHGGVLQNGQ